MQQGSGRSVGVWHLNTSRWRYSNAAISRFLAFLVWKSTFQLTSRIHEGSGSRIPREQLVVCIQRPLRAENRAARSGRGVSSISALPLVGTGRGGGDDSASESEGGDGTKDSSISEVSMVCVVVLRDYRFGSCGARDLKSTASADDQWGQFHSDMCKFQTHHRLSAPGLSSRPLACPVLVPEYE